MGRVLSSGFPGASLFALSCSHICSFFLAVYVGTYIACSRNSWKRCALCVQNYLTMLGSTVLIPFLLVTPMGGTPDDLAAGMHHTLTVLAHPSPAWNQREFSADNACTCSDPNNILCERHRHPCSDFCRRPAAYHPGTPLTKKAHAWPVQGQVGT